MSCRPCSYTRQALEAAAHARTRRDALLNPLQVRQRLLAGLCKEQPPCAKLQHEGNTDKLEQLRQLREQQQGAAGSARNRHGGAVYCAAAFAAACKSGISCCRVLQSGSSGEQRRTGHRQVCKWLDTTSTKLLSAWAKSKAIQRSSYAIFW